MLYTGALGSRLPSSSWRNCRFQLAARWAALPFGPKRPPAGLISLALQRPVKPAHQSGVGGPVRRRLDRSDSRRSGNHGNRISLRRSRSGSWAGGALAIPPGEAQTWDIDTFANILNETADLAKVRAVDLELLPHLGQLLPAIYLFDRP